VQLDLFVASLTETRSNDWRAVQTLLLAIEVLSPSSQRADRFTKRRRYQAVGIPLYWVVDPDAWSVGVWTPAPCSQRWNGTASSGHLPPRQRRSPSR